MSIFEDRPFIPKLDVQPTQKDKPKVGRYWPGKAPEWAEEQQEDSDEENEEVQAPPTGPIKVERKSDRRLERLQEGASVDKEEALRRRRDREVVAEIVSVAKKEEDDDARPGRRPNRDTVAEIVSIKTELPDEEEDDDADARRERARQQYLKQKTEDDEAMPVEEVEEEKEEESEEESEYETDSDYDEWSNRPTIQPVFVKKQARETIAERDKMLEEEEKLEELRIQEAKLRKKETITMIRDENERERIAMEMAEKGADDERIESDEEEEDEAKEYELWKQRELARIKRDREEREAMEKEKEETERRRNMSDAEIRQLDKDKFVKEKKQLKFLQKYYHKGAFFREGGETDIQNKDYSAPTGEDLINKESLPKVMQVKNFGRSGRTKYTHLADQDTTQKDAPWNQLDPGFTQKLGGMHGGFERPALKKRKMD
eukprot:Phypoly_transcript_02933.p1 GENE.Phypoly_transcript_02933~~Phypoly_transcript_02933.p1  ORF type:complete len:431 (-),score=135.11 Phypoly_transcript_02933:86-1378(-)